MEVSLLPAIILAVSAPALPAALHTARGECPQRNGRLLQGGTRAYDDPGFQERTPIRRIHPPVPVPAGPDNLPGCNQPLEDIRHRSLHLNGDLHGPGRGIRGNLHLHRRRLKGIHPHVPSRMADENRRINRPGVTRASLHRHQYSIPETRTEGAQVPHQLHRLLLLTRKNDEIPLGMERKVQGRRRKLQRPYPARQSRRENPQRK